MEATAKSTLMDCEGCSELLADFLLDELPESEAVLVHEHLLICPACMKAYRDLKGTGKALEAVASMQPIEGSETFRTEVRTKAKEESEKIVSKLPPDRRLRLEARREARQSIRMSRRAPPPKVWSPGLLVLALGAALVLAAILFWPKTDKPASHEALGKLTVALGKVDQFYKKANQPHTPVEEGKNFLPGDSFTTGEHSRARFDLADGGSMFLGSSTDVSFRLPQAGSPECSLQIDGGELGVNRPDAPASTGAVNNHDWEIRSDAGNLTVANSTHAYFHVVKNEKLVSLEVSVLAGCVHATTLDGHKSEPLYAGQRASLTSADASITVESLTDERPPAWRADIVTETDLAALLSGKVKIVSRKVGRVQVELVYNHETPTQDWTAEIGGATIGVKGDALSCPTAIKWKHVAPFAMPLSFELKVDPDARRDTGFAFGAFDSRDGDVAVDVSAREVVMTVRDKGKLPQSDHNVPRAQPGAAEKIVLQLKSEGLGFVGMLTATGGKSKTIPLWKDKTDAPGVIWFHALGEGLLLDEIKISGTLPAEWIRQRMSGAQ